MMRMPRRPYILSAGLVGIIAGYLTMHLPLAHSWTSAIFWIAVGLAIIYFSPDRGAAISAGALFGFLNIVSWLFAGFQGVPAQLPGLLVIMVIVSILCATAGALGAVLFYWIFRRGTLAGGEDTRVGDNL